MNREQAAKMLPIVQAWSEGKKIQYNPSGTNLWEDVEHDGLAVGWLARHPEQYRIKPEPRVYYGIRNAKGDVFGLEDDPEARDKHFDRWLAHGNENGWAKITLIERL